MSHCRPVRLLVACAAAFVLTPATSAFAGGPNAGDVWVDNSGQLPGPGHEMDPHLACQNIDLWGAALADSSGTYTIDGWAPSGSQRPDLGPSNWSYNQSTGGSQVLDVISVKTLIENAIAHGDAPQNSQGFHFKLQFSADPQKHKTFWVDCQLPSIETRAVSGTAGQPIHDVATLHGGSSPTGTITWNVYRAADVTCSSSLGTVASPVSGDGIVVSPNFLAPSAGAYQWVATYSGDSQNQSVSTSCNDPYEVSAVSKADPSISTAATPAALVGQPIGDSAVLSGGDSPTGSITWRVYAAGSGCLTPLLTTAPVPLNGDGTYSSPAFTPSVAGRYEWVASYSGDDNNTALISSCTDPSEQSVVETPTVPAIVQAPAQSTPTAAKQPVAPVTILRCAAGRVMKHKQARGRTVTACVPRRHVFAASHRRIPAPRFTG